MLSIWPSDIGWRRRFGVAADIVSIVSIAFKDVWTIPEATKRGEGGGKGEREGGGERKSENITWRMEVEHTKTPASSRTPSVVSHLCTISD